MIATMAELGSTEEHTEFFIVNNQKIPKLPDEEPVWTLSDVSHVHEDETSQPIDSLPTEQNSLKPKRKPGISSSWPPTDWKSAPDFHFAQLNQFRRKQWGAPSETAPKEYKNFEGSAHTENWSVPPEINGNWVLPDDSLDMMASASQDSVTEKSESSIAGGLGTSDKQASSSLHLVKKPPDSGRFPNPSACLTRDQICLGMPSENQAFITGRRGELVAYKYFVEKYGLAAVRWVNEETETGLPYDIVIGEKDENKQYIEVKATKSIRKDWFMVSTREWQFASERGNSFSIAYVILAEEKNAKITVFKDPVRLCQRDLLRLVILMSGQQKEFAVLT